MKIKNVFLLLSLFFFRSAYGQTNEPGQIALLLSLIATEHNDSNKILLLDSVAYLYKDVDPDKGIAHARQEQELAEKIGWKTGVAMANTSLGVNYQYKSEYPEALEYFYVALGIYEKAGKKVSIASNENSIGVIYQAQNNYGKALEYYTKALKIDEDTHNEASIAGDLGNIGNLYMMQGKMAKALENDRKSLAIFRSLGDSDGVAHNLGNIGNVYKELGSFRDALVYDKEALKIFETEGDNGSIALNLGNIGGIYLGIAKDTTGNIHYTDYDLSGKKQSLEQAIGYMERSIAISKKIGQLENIIEFSQGMSVAYAMLGDYKSALESYKLYTATKDSVFSNDNKLKISQLSMQRELAMQEKQRQINELENEHKRNRDEVYLLVIAILLLIGGIIMKRVFPKFF
jgi:tetratricopeptide (TPR) repeat protein